MISIPILPDCNNVLVVAPVSSGKSWLLQEWIKQMERSITIDVTAETMDDSFCHIWHSPSLLAQKLKQNPYYYRIAYHPSSLNFFEDFRWCVELSWIADTEKGEVLSRWLIVDEIHEVCSTNNITPEMDRIIRYARHIKLGFIGATQKFSDVPTILRDNCRMMVIFHNTDEIELKSIRGKFGNQGVEIVRNLRPLIYDEAKMETLQEPQCMVWKRGYGLQIHDLGNKIMGSEVLNYEPPKGENKVWEENLLVQQSEAVPVSLELASGQKENQ
jgi:hypothetical protein